MDKKTKKYLIYGGAGVGILGVIGFIYYEYQNSLSNQQNAPLNTNTNTSSGQTASSGYPAFATYQTGAGFASEPVSNVPYQTTSETPPASVVQTSATGGAGLNGFIGQLLANQPNNNAQQPNYVLPSVPSLAAPALPNLYTPLVKQITQYPPQPLIVL